MQPPMPEIAEDLRASLEQIESVLADLQERAAANGSASAAGASGT